MLTLYDSTKISNEYMMQFWNKLEECLPTNVNVTNIQSASDSVSIVMQSTDYDSIAKLVVDLRSVDCIQDAFIASIEKKEEDNSDSFVYEYTVTCNYVLPEFEAVSPTDDTTATDGSSTEATTEAAQ